MTNIVHDEMRRAVNDGIFPSAQLLVAKEGDVIFNEAFGNATLDTLFDIASLTKPISTVSQIMKLVDSDKLRLDDKAVDILKNCHSEEKKNITIRNLLNHSSGLPAWQAYYQTIPTDLIATTEGKLLILDSVCNEELTYKTGYQSIYSDIGYIVLGEIIEQIQKDSLDKLFLKEIAGPLELKNTFFVPIKDKDLHDKHRFAPTEDCPWRKKVIRGVVHDQNCYAMGGVAGHAGLFSNTSDVNKFIATFLDCYNGKGDFFSPEVVQRFLPFNNKLTECNSTWLIGWDRPSHVNSQAGQYFSKKSIGHLGYTGCSIWIDIEKNFWVVLLTNRVHPTSTNERIKQFRPMIQNIIYEEMLR